MNTECLTNNNSSSWTIFSTKLSSGCSFKSQAACLTAFSNSKSRFLGTSKDGNKSLIKPKKTGLSSQIILGKFKVYIIQVGSRNNFRLAGWNLGSPCIELAISLSAFWKWTEKINLSQFLLQEMVRFRDVSQLPAKLSPRDKVEFKYQCTGCSIHMISQIKSRAFWNLL